MQRTSLSMNEVFFILAVTVTDILYASVKAAQEAEDVEPESKDPFP